MKLLYAEDERSLSEAVVDILTYHKYIVDAVYNGEDAYDYAVSGDYDAQAGWNRGSFRPAEQQMQNADFAADR